MSVLQGSGLWLQCVPRVRAETEEREESEPDSGKVPTLWAVPTCWHPVGQSSGTWPLPPAWPGAGRLGDSQPSGPQVSGDPQKGSGTRSRACRLQAPRCEGLQRRCSVKGVCSFSSFLHRYRQRQQFRGVPLASQNQRSHHQWPDRETEILFHLQDFPAPSCLSL